MAAQERLDLGRGALDDVGAAELGPLLRVRAVADQGIEVVALHQLQRLLAAQIVARPLDADLAHGLERQRRLVDLDAADGAQGSADDVVVDHQALVAEAQEARLHAGGLVDQVGAGIADQRVVVGLLGPGLRVGQLGVAHARGDAGGQS